MGLRKASDFNLAFLTKLSWKVLTNEDMFGVKVIKDKYIKDGDIFNANIGNNSSCVGVAS